MFPDWLLPLLIPYLWPTYHPGAVCKAWYDVASIRTLFWRQWVSTVGLWPTRKAHGGCHWSQILHHPSMHPDTQRLVQQRQYERYVSKLANWHQPNFDRLWSFEQIVACLNELDDPRLIVAIHGVEAKPGLMLRHRVRMTLYAVESPTLWNKAGGNAWW